MQLLAVIVKRLLRTVLHRTVGTFDVGNLSSWLRRWHIVFVIDRLNLVSFLTMEKERFLGQEPQGAEGTLDFCPVRLGVRAVDFLTVVSCSTVQLERLRVLKVK